MSNIVPTVGVVVFNQDQHVLLIRHQGSSGHVVGTYGLPAGRLEPGESEKEAAQRELEEESGLVASELVELPEKYLADVQRSNGEVVRMSWTVFLCPQFTGELRGADDSDPQWVEIEKLESYPLNPNVDKAIYQALELRRGL